MKHFLYHSITQTESDYYIIRDANRQDVVVVRDLALAERIAGALSLVDQLQVAFEGEATMGVDPIDYDKWTHQEILAVAEGKVALEDITWGQWEGFKADLEERLGHPVEIEEDN